MPCYVCRSTKVEPGLDAGSHPVSTFFAKSATATEQRYPLVLAQCQDCGVIQLTKPVPHTALVPPYDWLFAREPEEHLDTAVAHILALPGITKNSVIAGLTSKDDTTLERFRKHGFSNVWRVSVAEDLGVANPCANIETVQIKTEPQRMTEIANRRGAADVLVVRHIIEHAENLAAFVAGCAALVKPNGYIMVELPDCTTSLERQDYAMIWEEHALYFVPETFAGVTALGGFKTIRTDIYPLPFENCIVEIAQKTATPAVAVPSPASRATVGQLARYASGFAPMSAALRRGLTAWRKTHGPIVLFGAGHLACAFVNFHDCADLIDFVADDTPQKQGLFLPGAKLEILPSRELVARGVKLAVLALSIQNENAVIARNTAFTQAGGQFASIFAASPRSIRNLPGFSV
jgi:C-methyltransferase C-terminal domain/Putative zinc binding domain/Methyltransferase domain